MGKFKADNGTEHARIKGDDEWSVTQGFSMKMKKPRLAAWVAGGFALCVAIVAASYLLDGPPRVHIVERPETGFKFPDVTEIESMKAIRLSGYPDSDEDYTFEVAAEHWPAILHSLIPNELAPEWPGGGGYPSMMFVANMEIRKKSGELIKVQLLDAFDELWFDIFTANGRTFYHAGAVDTVRQLLRVARQTQRVSAN